MKNYQENSSFNKIWQQ